MAICCCRLARYEEALQIHFGSTLEQPVEAILLETAFCYGGGT